MPPYSNHAVAMDPELLAIVGVSLKVALVACALMLLPALALGYWLARTKSPLRPLVQALVALPMVLPPVVTGLVLLRMFASDAVFGRAYELLFGQPLLLSWPAASLAAAAVASPLLVFGAARGFESVPKRAEDVARSLGASRWVAFRRVTLPLAARGIGFGLLFAFARAIGEFGATILVAGRIRGETETLSLAIFDAIESFEDSTAWTLAGLAASIALAATLLAELLLRRGRA